MLCDTHFKWANITQQSKLGTFIPIIKHVCNNMLCYEILFALASYTYLSDIATFALCEIIKQYRHRCTVLSKCPIYREGVFRCTLCTSSVMLVSKSSSATGVLQLCVCAMLAHRNVHNFPSLVPLHKLDQCSWHHPFHPCHHHLYQCYKWT